MILKLLLIVLRCAEEYATKVFKGSLLFYIINFLLLQLMNASESNGKK